MAETFTSGDFAVATDAGADTPTPETPVESSTPTETAAAPAPAAIEQAAPVVPARKRGPIPIDEHEKVLANTREKTRAEARAEFDKEMAPYAWAKSIDQRQYADLMQWRQKAAADPVGFLEQAMAEADANPQHAPLIKSLAARWLGRRQGQAPARDDEEPGPDIPTDASNGVPVVYSAERQKAREAWFEKQLLGKVREQFAPMQEMFQTTQKREQVFQQQRAADAYSKAEYDKAKSWPGFEEHKSEIAAVLARTTLASDDPREVSIALRDAYLQVWQQQVYPTLNQSARASAVADITRKAGAATVNPSSSTTAPPTDASTRSFSDLLKDAFAAGR